MTDPYDGGCMTEIWWLAVSVILTFIGFLIARIWF